MTDEEAYDCGVYARYAGYPITDCANYPPEQSHLADNWKQGWLDHDRLPGKSVEKIIARKKGEAYAEYLQDT